MSSKRQTQEQQQEAAETADEQDSPGGGQSEPIALACNGCRKRKLRCSRELPVCQNCRKISSECLYKTKRNKPGLKPGAVENLHRRLDALERVVHQRDHEVQANGDAPSGVSDTQEKSAYGILNLLARELPRFINQTPGSSLDAQTSPDDRFGTGSAKRRRVAEASHSSEDESTPALPPSDSLDAVLRTYFSCIHPWIPMVHQTMFRRRLADPNERPKLDALLHAIVLAAARFVDEDDVVVWHPGRSRSWVVAAAMDTISLESLQALIIVAFNDIGSGETSRAWSLIGSMTRTVEYLQLTAEYEESERRPLLQPFRSLAPTDDWTENEERRRVFWNIFILDRFCCVTMGWNTNLTSDDVRRRLPCDGILWRKQQPVSTPFFGVWDKTPSQTGNPATFNPHPKDAATAESAIGGGAASGRPDIDMTTVGAYAYRIEATESLGRVTSHFLQQRINTHDQQDISLWLTRFNELDLRLVRWKLLLPQKWKADSYLRSRAGTPLIMDPNLTLAHVTHNTSMILLHQLIAFPPAGWAFRHKLPSVCSAETCVAAATEIATITVNYLKSTPVRSPVASEYAFCVYIAARALLVHWRHYVEAELLPQFWVLVQALESFSGRWRGRSGEPQSVTASDVAAKYAGRLRELHGHYLRNEEFRVNVPGYTTEINHSMAASSALAKGKGPNRQHQLPPPQPHQHEQAMPLPQDIGHWMYGASEALGGLGFGDRYHSAGQMPTGVALGAAVVEGSLMIPEVPEMMATDNIDVIWQTLLDQQFVDVDRIISFDDGSMFAAMDGAGGW